MFGAAIGQQIWSWLSRPAYVDPLPPGSGFWVFPAVGAGFGYVAGLCYIFAAAVFPAWAAALLAVTCLGILTHALHWCDSDEEKRRKNQPGEAAPQKQPRESAGEDELTEAVGLFPSEDGE